MGWKAAIEQAKKASTLQNTWAACSAQLGSWAMALLVNRTDVWGGYVPLADRGKSFTRADGSQGVLGSVLTHPPKKQRGTTFLTEATLARHFRATAPEHIVGVHSTSPQNTSLWGGIDIDQHGETSAPPEVNLAAALAWHCRLCWLDFNPLLIDSNNQGGYHLLALFDQPVPTPRVHAFMRWLVRDYRDYGLAVAPEVFPKQAKIKGDGYGNWLRLPGKHYKHEHWSRIWDGSTWLEADGAIDYLLACRGDPSGCIPFAALPFMRPPSQPSPSVRQPIVSSDDELSRRIAAYAAKLPHGLCEGQNRHYYAYRFAAFLVRDLQQSNQTALQWLKDWDTGNAVPLGDNELAKQLHCAHTYGRHDYGSGLECSKPATKRRRRYVSVAFQVRP
jgi:hypothetical protein